MNPAEITAVVNVVETIVAAIIKDGPAIQKGISTAAPYVQALVGLITGSNVTQQQLDDAIESIKALSADFQQPLPPET